MKIKRNYILISIFIIILIIITIFIIKVQENGNTINNQDIESYILNINSYEAETEVNIKTNKNENNYKIIQKYFGENSIEQEILEPEEVKGIKIIKEENKVTIQNSKLGISKTFENYYEIAQNDLDLISFLTDYRENEKNMKETNNEYILEIKIKNNNKYSKYKTLYIDKNTKIPTKMEIKDINKNTIVYIVYNKVKISNIPKNITAFKIENAKIEI